MSREDIHNNIEQEIFERGTKLQFEILKIAKERKLVNSARVTEWALNGEAKQFREWLTAQFKENPFIPDEELREMAINYFLLPN